MKSIRIRTIIFALLVLLLVLAVYLTYVNSIGETEGVCVVVIDEDAAGCSDVQNSAYGVIFGVSVAQIGLAGFSILFLLYFFASTRNKFHKGAHDIFVLFSFIGALSAVYFIGVQVFILKTLCSTCLIVDFSMIFVFLLGYLESHKIGHG